MQALDLTGAYTSAEVIAALTAQSGTRSLTFRHDRLDSGNKYLGPIRSMTAAEVSNASLASIKRTAKFTLLDSEGINYGSDRIRPWARLAMPADSRVGYVEWPLGVFVLASPVREYDPVTGDVRRVVDAYDQALILQQDQISDRYSIAAGTLYTNAIATLVAGYTFTASIVPSAATLAVALEWAPGTTVLQILNDLLAGCNYYSALFNEQGSLVCKPYLSPASRASEYTYADDQHSTITGKLAQNLDLYSVPNKWVLILSEPGLASPLVGSYTNANPLSPTSTVARGRTITKVVTETIAADQTTLTALAAKMAFSESQVYETVTMTTALMPMHSDSDVITLVVGPLGVSAPYAETAWTMPLKAGATMSHSVRRVVSI